MNLKKEKFTEQEIVRREKLQKILDLGVNPYFSSFKNTIKIDQLHDLYGNLKRENLEKETNNKNYQVAGRIMNLRSQGKIKFLTIKNFSGKIQIYIKKEFLSELDWDISELLDIGDIVGISGSIMKTHVGELTIRANKLDILTKSLKPLPEKFHGLKNQEDIYRKRYLDLIINQGSQDIFVKRTLVINSIRNFLHEQGYLEFETPILQSQATGAAAKPFVTYHNSLKQNFILRIATELHLKRLIVGGFDKVYEIGRVFRNEGISIKHNPEFTMIEIYEAYGDLNSMIKLTEDIIERAAMDVIGTTEIVYQGKKISLKKPFKKVEMTDLIKEKTGIDFLKVKTLQEAKLLAEKHNVELKSHFNSIGYIINEFFEEKCEADLIQPIFVTGYPIEVSPLARKRKENPTITDRFELFIFGRESANAFSELHDADDQYQRFLDQVEEGQRGNEEANEMDLDYIEALRYGMPPTGGLGIGIDRLVMILTDSSSIRDVILFPHQRDKNN